MSLSTRYLVKNLFTTNCKNLIPSSIQRNGINPSEEPR